MHLQLHIVLMMPILALALESPIMKGELVFSKWPKSPMIPLKAMMIKVRGPAKLPSQIILTKIQSRPSRPIQKIILPSYTQLMKPSSYGLRPPYPGYTHMKPIMFHTSPPGPNSGEYVYEDPFQPPTTIMSQAGGPIHTVPAPNLAPLGALTPVVPIQSNHIYETPTPTMSPYYAPPRPVSVKPYQVTEEPTNDLTLRNPYSGKQTYYAPDPDPRLPVAKIPIETNRYSQPTNGKTLPRDVAAYTHLPKHSEHTNPSAATQHILQYVKLGTRPIFPYMQKHVAEQMTMLHGMPDSVYNPTYLVTQSNNLLQQHQQHLFRPDPGFLSTYQQQQQRPQTHITQNTVPESYQNAASPGQIYAAQHDQLQHQHDQYHEHQYQTQHDSYQPQHNQYQHDQFQPQQNHLTTQDDTAAAYKQLLDQATQYYQSGSYLNFQRSPSSTRAPYVAESSPTPSFFYSPDLAAKHQEENARILQQANEELITKGYSTFHDEPEASFTHQQPVIKESIDTDKTMRIYVPDDEFTTESQQVSFQYRSDDTSATKDTKTDAARET
ncbi:uncharacterized protein LOC129786256 [Lutzomyia longipalpis]|uniref:uncharacterized protein LOC129786256 n=1 Tax=Lutzomyia longipalpis TaxID=7200 RepID=UPI002483D736|nr:uncharacterized protein LOC129786256 [Lutzomyia longipalpis]